MDINIIKEDYSTAVFRSVAAICGWSVGEWSQDTDCVDTSIKKTIRTGTAERPQTCDIQLKCTENPTANNEEFISFSLKPKHYDSIKKKKFGTPFLLCVVLVPKNIDDWHQLVGCENHNHNTILKHCGYFSFLSDHLNRSLDESSKTIRFIKGEDELSVQNFRKFESKLSSPEYNISRAKAELSHLENMLS